MVGHFHSSHLFQVCIKQAFLTHSCVTHIHVIRIHAACTPHTCRHACTHPAGKCCCLLLLSHVNHDGVDCLEGHTTLSPLPSSFTGLLQFLLHEHNCLGTLTSTFHGCALVLMLAPELGKAEKVNHAGSLNRSRAYHYSEILLLSLRGCLSQGFYCREKTPRPRQC